MKWRVFTLGVAFSLLLSACTMEESESEVGYAFDGDLFRVVTSTVVEPADAMKEVNALLEAIDIPTRSGGRRSIASCVSVGGFGATRSGESEVESPLYYIMNFENDEGFAVASGDMRTPPVFCITEEGHLDNLDMIANPEESEVPGVGIMFAEYDLNYRIAVGLPIQDLNGNWINPDDPAYPASSGIGGWGDGGWGGGAGIPLDDEGVVYYSMWRTKENIGTIIPARWGQTGPPYNTYTKWNSVGCATAAVAIVMYHWGQPVNYKSAYWDWSEIRKHIGTLNDSEIYKNAYPEIGAIYCELVRNQNLNPIDLGSNGLAVLPKNIPPTLTNLGYQSGGGNQNYNYATIKQGLQLGQPAIVLGFDSSKILGIHTGGHYWVVDAILCQERTKLTQRMPPFQSTSEIEVREFVHVNWGWDGRKNGYFYPNKYDSEHPAQTNVQTRSSGDGYFRYDLSMNTGIRWRK